MSVSTIGKDATHAEIVRREVILDILQDRTSLLSQPFFQCIWLPHERTPWPKQDHQTLEPPIHFLGSLNNSQRTAVKKILSSDDDNRVVMIHGPPGTGKTTVIAAAVTSFHQAYPKRSVWIAAQSNVAVKNIAEKFCDAKFHDFNLLVSWDFHFDWCVCFPFKLLSFLIFTRHEHLYGGVLQARLIRSDSFNEHIVGAERRLLGTRVILCTLAMLSNPSISVFTRLAPVNTVIFDEASQIEVGNYVPVFHCHSKALRKVVFIGDHKQCLYILFSSMTSYQLRYIVAPYGQEDIRGLQSVFEFDHLREKAVFLDTQCMLFFF